MTAKVDLSPYDFIDFGCSTGGSIAFAMKHLGGTRGIGVDIDPRKLKATRDAGYEAVEADLTKPTDFDGAARFAIMSHFLEHLPSVALASTIIGTATKVARDFILIRQPWFDSNGLLAREGFKFFWSDWRGHSNHMTTLDFYLILDRLLNNQAIAGFSIWGHSRVKTSFDDSIIPLNAGRDRHHYDAATDAPKREMDFGFPCFREVVVLVKVAAGEPDAHLRLPAFFTRNADLMLERSANAAALGVA